MVQSYLNLFSGFFLRMLISCILFLLSKYGIILFCFLIVLFINASDVFRINHSLRSWKVLWANTFTHFLKWTRLKHWLVTTAALSRCEEKAMGITLIKLINSEFPFKLLCVLFSQQIQPQAQPELIKDKPWSWSLVWWISVSLLFLF